MMRSLLFLIFILGSITVSGQSAKKLNKRLLAEFASEQQKQDSAFAVFTQTKREFDSLKRVTNEKIDLLSVGESGVKKLVLKIDESTGQLKELGFDPNSFIISTDLKKDGFLRYRDFVRPVKEVLKTETKFDKVSNRLYLDMMKRKEQNVQLTQKVKEYRDCAKINSIRQGALELANEQLIAFFPKLDSMSRVYQLIANQLATNKRKLEDKLNELRANYIAKGPHGFPDAYKRVFYDAFPPSQEEMIREVDISNSEWVDGSFDIDPSPRAIAIERENSNILTIVDEPASFPGGNEALKIFISKNLRYPEKMKEAHISGKVYLKFVVSETGELSDIKIARGIPDCKECDDEAVRMTKSMPKWIPGKNNGKVVKSIYNLPVKFQLD